MKQDTKWKLRDSEGKEYIIIDTEKVDMQEELNKMITKQMNEIERLKDLCNKYEEEHKTTFEEWKKAINIIKEVREYINKIPTQPVIRVFKKELLEILDKVGVDKE